MEITLTTAESDAATLAAGREAEELCLDEAQTEAHLAMKLRLAADAKALEVGACAPGLAWIAFQLGEFGELSEQVDQLRALAEHLEDSIGHIEDAVVGKRPRASTPPDVAPTDQGAILGRKLGRLEASVDLFLRGEVDLAQLRAALESSRA